MNKFASIAALVLAAAGAASCGEEKGVHPLTADQLKAELAGASISYKPNPTGATQTISGAGTVEGSVGVTLSSSNGGEYTRRCLIRFAEAGSGSTRVQADCDRGAGSSSQSRTMEELDEASVMEFVDAHLAARPFNYKAVVLKQAGVVGKNLDADRKEALENYDRAQSGIYDSEGDADLEAMMADSVNQMELEGAGWGTE